MAKNTGKRRRHRNRFQRKIQARIRRMVAPISQPRGYMAIGRKTFIVEHLGPGVASITSTVDPTDPNPEPNVIHTHRGS